MAMFRGFKPQGLQKIANRLGYQGSLDNFDNYLEQNPEKKRQMIVFEDAAKQMARGGVVKMQTGGAPTQSTPSFTPAGQAYVTTLGEGEGQVPAFSGDPSLQDVTGTLSQTGAIPVGAVTQPQLTPVMQEQIIQPDLGALGTTPTTPTAQAITAQADAPVTATATQMEAAQASPQVQDAIQANQAAQTDLNDPRAKVVAAQQTASSVANVTAAQGNSIQLDNPIQRQIQAGELIDSTADAEKARAFTEQIEAATSTPTDQATVAGQLAGLTANFDATNPPAWAAGAIRGVQAVMQQRGLGASSIAGQALVQAAMESALPIAQADANTIRTFELQNLSNRQQRAILAAQQRANFIGLEFDQAFQARVQNSARIADIANKNFTAEQNIALENSRAANTVNLNNLSNRQALVMAEASALAQLDTANLNARQQASVQNAQNFLQIDMANLSNEQQTGLFNAQAQFNAGEANTVSRFNAEVSNQRDQFNATNQLAIAQNNAVWRREIATADTVALNRANELNAKAVLDVSNQQYDNLWQFYADTMEWAWKSAESELDRINAMAVAEVSKEAQEYSANATKSAAGKTALGSMMGTLGAAIIGL